MSSSPRRRALSKPPSEVHQLARDDASRKIPGGVAVGGCEVLVLAEERVLGLDLDLGHTGQIHCTSDVQVEFGRDDIRVSSLPPGHVDFYYPYNPPGETIPVSREDLSPLWGAWLPEIQAVLLAAVLVTLLVLPLYVPVLICGALAVERSAGGLSPAPGLMVLGALSLGAAALAPWAIGAALRVSVE